MSKQVNAFSQQQISMKLSVKSRQRKNQSQVFWILWEQELRPLVFIHAKFKTKKDLLFHVVGRSRRCVMWYFFLTEDRRFFSPKKSVLFTPMWRRLGDWGAQNESRFNLSRMKVEYKHRFIEYKEYANGTKTYVRVRTHKKTSTANFMIGNRKDVMIILS